MMSIPPWMKSVDVGKKGVDTIDTRGKIFYLTKKNNSGLGVRNPKTEYMIKTNPVSMLLYQKPCVCGSLSHRTSKDPDCLCNDIYNDAVEIKKSLLTPVTDIMVSILDNIE